MKKTSLLLTIIFLSHWNFAQEWDWSNHFTVGEDAYPSANIVMDIASDANSNIYHCGGFDGADLTILGTTLTNTNSNRWDAFVTKFDENGTLQWINQIGSAHHDEASALAIIGEFVFVAGNYRNDVSFNGSNTLPHAGIGSYNTYLVKYDTLGNFLNATQVFWGTDGSSVTRVKDMVWDPYRQELVLTGFFKVDLNYFDGVANSSITTIEGGKDMFIAQIDTSGAVNNINSFYTLASDNGSVIKDISISTDSSYYLSGDLFDTLIFESGDSVFGDINRNSDALLIKVDKDLNKEWVRTASSTGFDHANSSVTDIYRNVYLTGKVESTVTFKNSDGYSDEILDGYGASDIFLTKYYPDGRIAWVKRKGSSGNDNGYGIDISENLVQFCGNFADTVIFNDDTLTSSAVSDINTGFAIFDLDGNEIGAQSLGGTLIDEGRSLAFNTNGNTIIAGYFYSASLAIGDSSYTNASSPTYRDGFIASFRYPFSANLSEESSISCPQGNNGSLLVTTFFGVGPYTYDWSSPDTSTIESNDSLAYNLAAGSYQVTVTDSRGKQAVTGLYVLTDPEDFNVQLNPTNLTCFESSNGAIDATISGGTGAYSYGWTGPSGDDPTAEDQTNLTAGEYFLTVTDDNGCQAQDSVTLTQPGQLQFGNVVVTEADPAGTGSIDLDVSGGTGVYTYAWVFNIIDSLIGRVNDTLLGLDEGDYKAYVTDENLCQSDTIIVVPGENLRVDLVGTDVSCYNMGNGSAYATIISGRKSFPFTYSFKDEGGTPITPANDSIIQSLAPGKYFVTAVEQGGEAREATDSVIISEPDTLSLSLDADSISCYNGSNGAITLLVSGGEGTYSYLWSNSSTSKNLTNLPAGWYTVEVTDGNDCTTTDSVEVEQPDSLTIDININQYITCFGFNSGQLLAQVEGGTEPYSFSWNEGIQVNQLASNLYSGSYTVDVTDNNGCTNNTSVELTDPLPLVFETVDTNHVSCLNANDGSISVSMAGGETPYTYTWNQAGLGNTNSISKLFPILYELLVTDANGCKNDSLSFMVKQPETALSLEEVSGSHNDNACNGDNLGELEVSASGGWGNYSYSRDLLSWQETALFGGLAASEYTVSVKDTFGCIVGVDIEITQPEILSLSVSKSGNTIEVEGQGGTGPYMYSLDGGTFQVSGSFAGLLGGSYTVEVTDASDCGPVSQSVNITDVELTELNNFLDIYPNPSSGIFNLKFNIQSESELQISVYSIIGSKVYSNVESLSAGPAQIVNIDLSDQQAGVYLLEINGIMLDEKLIVE